MDNPTLSHAVEQLLSAGYVVEQLQQLTNEKIMSLAARLPENTCCFCRETFCGWGNSPSPVMEDEGAVACGECNAAIVLPQRFRVKRATV